MSRRVYLIALTVESSNDTDLDGDAELDQIVENVVSFSTAREAIDAGLGGAGDHELVGLMVVGRIPTYEEVTP